MAVAVVAAIAALPSSMRPESRWLLAITGLVLLVLIIADPGRIDRSTRSTAAAPSRGRSSTPTSRSRSR